jgi:hypothetical protein
MVFHVGSWAMWKCLKALEDRTEPCHRQKRCFFGRLVFGKMSYQSAIRMKHAEVGTSDGIPYYLASAPGAEVMENQCA